MNYAVSLDQFEGPLDLLVHLLQKKEVDAGQIAVQQITGPFRDMVAISQSSDYFDLGADFILLAAQIALLKSKFLLPSREAGEGLELDLEEDPQFSIIHHLIDYCRFKEVAVNFAELEGKQGDHYARGLKMEGDKKPLGLAGVQLSELEELFQEVLRKRVHLVGKIEEEEFLVHDKINWLRKKVPPQAKSKFFDLFEEAKSKLELIVIFLSILELIKVGELQIIKDSEIYVYGV